MMLYHVPNLEQALSEVRRVLKPDGIFYAATYGENGMMEYICTLFQEYGVTDPVKHTFTLQNGQKLLQLYFDSVRIEKYEDALEVTDIHDMAAYIASLEGMSGLQDLPKETILKVLARHVKDGVLHVPKEYGMFICQ